MSKKKPTVQKTARVSVDPETYFNDIVDDVRHLPRSEYEEFIRGLKSCIEAEMEAWG